jgi:hypothetical protein
MATTLWAAILSSTKPGLLVRVVAVAAEDDRAAAVAVADTAVAGAEDVGVVVGVAAVVAEAAGIATAEIAVAEATVAGKSPKHLRLAKEPGSLEAPRFCFWDTCI